MPSDDTVRGLDVRCSKQENPKAGTSRILSTASRVSELAFKILCILVTTTACPRSKLRSNLVKCLKFSALPKVINVTLE